MNRRRELGSSERRGMPTLQGVAARGHASAEVVILNVMRGAQRLLDDSFAQPGAPMPHARRASASLQGRRGLESGKASGQSANSLSGAHLRRDDH